MALTFTFSEVRDQQSSSDNDQGRSFNQVFHVEASGYTGSLPTSDDLMDWAYAQRAAAVTPRLPVKRDQRGSSSLYALDVNANPIGESPTDFHYVVQWKASRPVSVLPWDNEPEISRNPSTTAEDVPIDLDGTPVANPLGDPYEPAPQRERGEFVVVITRNEQYNPGSAYANVHRSINGATWHGYDAKTAKLTMSDTKVFDGTYTYWKVTYTIAIKVDGTTWHSEPFEYGYRYKVVNTDTHEKWKSDKDSDGNAVAVFLAQDGTKNTGDPGIANAGNGFKIFRHADWSSLGLPDPDA